MNNIVSAISWLFPGQILKRVFVREIKGKDNFPKRNFILAANHLSHLDWLIDGAVLTPRRATFIAQIDKMKGIKGLMRDLVYLYVGSIPVNRNDRDSKRKALLAAIDMVKKGYCLAMYPEGSRSRDGRLHEFKPGVGKIYLETGAPVVPVANIGTYGLMPPGGKLKKEKKVIIKIGKPMEFPQELAAAAGLDKNSDEYRRLCTVIAKKTEDAVRKLLQEEGIINPGQG